MVCERRARWKSEQVRLLLIAESAPNDGGEEANRRFFYDDALTGRDGLFRQVVQMLFEHPQLERGAGRKLLWLDKLRDWGVYLIDLASVPVNYHSPSERATALKGNIAATVSLATDLKPDGIILVKKNVFELLQKPILEAGLPLLHESFILFPGSGQQKRFREKFAAATEQLGT